MTEEKITKGVKVVICTVLLLAGMLIGALVKEASPMGNGFILLVTVGVVVAVWKH